MLPVRSIKPACMLCTRVSKPVECWDLFLGKKKRKGLKKEIIPFILFSLFLQSLPQCITAALPSLPSGSVHWTCPVLGAVGWAARGIEGALKAEATI